MAKTRMGIIGLGLAVTPHAKSLLDLSDRVEVAHATSRTAERRQAFAADFPFPLADSVDTILDDASIDAILLLTTPDCHLEFVRRAAAAGKHILMEKPLDVTSERAAELVATCRDAGVTLGIVLQHRFRPAGERLGEILASGRLGGLVGASLYVHIWRPQSYYDQPGRGDKLRDGGGVLLTQGIHPIDLFISLAGQPVEVTGYARTTPLHQMETEDMAVAALSFENGAIGTISATTCAIPGAPERIELICEKGTAILEGGLNLHIAYHDGTEEIIESDETPGGTGADPMSGSYAHHRSVLADFLDALDEGREPRVTGEAALKSHRLIDAILESAEQGRPVAVIRD